MLVAQSRSKHMFDSELYHTVHFVNQKLKKLVNEENVVDGTKPTEPEGRRILYIVAFLDYETMSTKQTKQRRIICELICLTDQFFSFVMLLQKHYLEGI